MSIEIYALSDRRLSSIAEWQQAIHQEGFDLRLDTSRPFEELDGHLPAHRGEQHAGFECDHWDAAEVIDGYDDIDFGHRWTENLAFRFGGDFLALWGAFAAATAYARATNGVVFDPQAGEVMSPDRAAEVTRQIDRDIPQE
jgi:hypothetical protein